MNEKQFLQRNQERVQRKKVKDNAKAGLLYGCYGFLFLLVGILTGPNLTYWYAIYGCLGVVALSLLLQLLNSKCWEVYFVYILTFLVNAVAAGLILRTYFTYYDCPLDWITIMEGYGIALVLFLVWMYIASQSGWIAHKISLLGIVIVLCMVALGGLFWYFNTPLTSFSFFLSLWIGIYSYITILCKPSKENRMKVISRAGIVSNLILLMVIFGMTWYNTFE